MASLAAGSNQATHGTPPSSPEEGELTDHKLQYSAEYVAYIEAKLNQVSMERDESRAQLNDAQIHFNAEVERGRVMHRGLDYQRHMVSQLKNNYKARYEEQDQKAAALRQSIRSLEKAIETQRRQSGPIYGLHDGQGQSANQMVHMDPLLSNQTYHPPHGFEFVIDPASSTGLDYGLESVVDTCDTQLDMAGQAAGLERETTAANNLSIAAIVQPPISAEGDETKYDGLKRGQEDQGGGAKKKRKSKQNLS